jgi:hypothetical protein
LSSRSSVPLRFPTLVRGFFFGALVGLLQIFPGLLQSAEGIVVGLRGLAVLTDGAFALAGDIENLAQLDMAPDFGPARLAVPVNRRPVSVGRGLIVPLIEEDLGNAVVGERTVFVEVESFVEALLNSMSAPDRSPCC